MRKILILIGFLAMTLAAAATDYTDRLDVSVSGVPTASQSATIGLTQQSNGKYTLLLKNFTIAIGGSPMGIGTIEVNDITGVTTDGVTTLIADQVVPIKEGDTASPSGTWVGPTMLGSVPVKLIGEQRDNQLYSIIDIDLQSKLGMTVRVTFGHGGYQLPNADFELFHKEKAIDEPNHWHSFASCQGTWASMVSGTPHTFVSDVVRPGTAGKHSVLVTATKILSFVANGTLTTGRMNAGDFSATSTKNNAQLDMSATAVDANGDPFHTAINAVPDALKLWVKFKQGTPSTQYPYASVNAVVTDGTYYQDPEDKTYTNVAARAKNNTIATNGYAWQEITVPFAKVSDAVAPKALLVTISTNATPGQGGLDTLYIDDLSLEYRQDITVSGVSVKGQALTVADAMTRNGLDGVAVTPEDIVFTTAAPKVIKSLEKTATGVVATVTVASTDLKTFKTYTINIPSATTGISAVTATTPDAAAVYTLQGHRVSRMQAGNVYIVKQNGKAVKMIAR